MAVVVSPAVGSMAVAAVAAAAVGVAAAWAENKMVNITNLSILYASCKPVLNRTYRSVPAPDLRPYLNIFNATGSPCHELTSRDNSTPPSI